LGEPSGAPIVDRAGRLDRRTRAREARGDKEFSVVSMHKVVKQAPGVIARKFSCAMK
jgi:hypothetical protein